MSENIIFAVCFCAELSPFKSTESPIVSDQVAQARDVLGSVCLCLPLPCQEPPANSRASYSYYLQRARFKGMTSLRRKTLTCFLEDTTLHFQGFATTHKKAQTAQEHRHLADMTRTPGKGRWGRAWARRDGARGPTLPPGCPGPCTLPGIAAGAEGSGTRAACAHLPGTWQERFGPGWWDFGCRSPAPRWFREAPAPRQPPAPGPLRAHTLCSQPAVWEPRSANQLCPKHLARQKRDPLF